jgi:hypothetical protein
MEGVLLLLQNFVGEFLHLQNHHLDKIMVLEIKLDLLKLVLHRFRRLQLQNLLQMKFLLYHLVTFLVLLNQL